MIFDKVLIRGKGDFLMNDSRKIRNSYAEDLSWIFILRL